MARRARKRAEKMREEATVLDAIVKESASADAAPAILKKQALVKAVAAATDQPNRVVRPVIEAALVELRRALEAGQDLQLPPLGRVRVGKVGGKDGNTVISAKIRLARQQPEGAEDVAPAGDDPAPTPLAQAAE